MAGMAECGTIHGVDGGAENGVCPWRRAEWGARTEKGEEGERGEEAGEMDEDERRDGAEYGASKAEIRSCGQEAVKWVMHEGFEEECNDITIQYNYVTTMMLMKNEVAGRGRFRLADGQETVRGQARRRLQVYLVLSTQLDESSEMMLASNSLFDR